MAGLDRSFYTAKDASQAERPKEPVAVVGYGHLGRSVALNLNDSGLSVVVGARPGDAATAARSEGFEVVTIDQAVSGYPSVWFCLPDELVPGLLDAAGDVHPQEDALVCVSSGYAYSYGLAKPSASLDLVILAPRMLGPEIRRRFVEGGSFYSFFAVEQDGTGHGPARLLGLAEAFGALRGGALVVPAATEADLDLFIEQAVGPYLGAAVLTAFEVATAAGFPPEAVALEMYLSGEMAETWRAFAEAGFYKGVRAHGHASAYGGFIRMGDVDIEAMRSMFLSVLEDIQSSKFAARYQEELANGSPSLEIIDAMTAGGDPMSQAEERLRLLARGEAC